MHWFFWSEATPAGPLTLPEEEWKHIKTSRIKPGEKVAVTNGKGEVWKAVFGLNDKVPSLEVESFLRYPTPTKGVHLALPMTQDPSRVEWLLEKATEMRLLSLTFLQTQYSESSKINYNRLNRIAIAACKQSHNPFLPSIHPVMNWQEWLDAYQTFPRFVGHCAEGEKKGWAEGPMGLPVAVAIGPEGDFSGSEIELATARGCTPIQLGSARLRTETAGLLVVSSYYSVERL